MKQVAMFYKVSFDQFKKDFYLNFLKIDTPNHLENNMDELIEKIYEGITLPKRKTHGSAGYDFVSPFDFDLEVGESIMIPTGIRCKIDPGFFLQIVPKSGIGSKYKMTFANTVGIVDSDYFGAENEGHIFVKMVYEGLNPCKGFYLDDKGIFVQQHEKNLKPTASFKAGTSFCQGIFVPYGVTVNDEEDEKEVRVGGYGSTSGKSELEK